MSNSEDLKKIREALSDYYELARKLRDDEIREAGYAEGEHEEMLRAEEALRLFDAHVAALSQQEAEPVAYLWAGVLIRADESHPNHRSEGAALYRHQPKSHNQSPIAHVWDDNNGFGGSPSRRVGFEYPQYFHGPVTKLYDHASPIDVKTIMAELRSHCESNNELVPEQSIDDTLLSTEKMMGREAPKPASRPIEPSPQPVASVPQDVEEFIKNSSDKGIWFHDQKVVPVDALRTLMAGKALVPVEVLDLTRFLANTWSAIDSFVYENCSGDALVKYPVIQGTRNQANIRKIGAQTYSADAIKSGVEFMLEAAKGE